eukprot:TRINITY_DN16405_c0_g1_i1.p1 TRINITY_DN16405_c0_g1~~TRINITY_DN16405_c0_g1_i1.p1  ORF type:complete len:265 (+),score=36.72 TRINITY_DN16405_c0_g1_i1:37-795(+)
MCIRDRLRTEHLNIFFEEIDRVTTQEEVVVDVTQAQSFSWNQIFEPNCSQIVLYISGGSKLTVNLIEDYMSAMPSLYNTLHLVLLSHSQVGPETGYAELVNYKYLKSLLKPINGKVFFANATCKLWQLEESASSRIDSAIMENSLRSIGSEGEKIRWMREFVFSFPLQIAKRDVKEPSSLTHLDQVSTKVSSFEIRDDSSTELSAKFIDLIVYLRLVSGWNLFRVPTKEDYKPSFICGFRKKYRHNLSLIHI